MLGVARLCHVLSAVRRTGRFWVRDPTHIHVWAKRERWLLSGTSAHILNAHTCTLFFRSSIYPRDPLIAPCLVTPCWHTGNVIFRIKNLVSISQFANLGFVHKTIYSFIHIFSLSFYIHTIQCVSIFAV